MAKYDPLGAHLARRASVEIELAFEEVERIIGSALPASASRPQWWANESIADSNHVQCRAWQGAGYNAFLLPHRRVLFTRKED